ncbi:hypothetical protein TEA_018767 [Camellia sinensis var. sinensis]|uniref:Uncharacterized protein n=1 Tax=Camellia sinensis var. sinensis TaxID=542762 RepID=A0A4S4EP86_CAMSN|nr:hypothetical protein TEA_018767 [Camellia sinensis var. sinensis]
MYISELLQSNFLNEPRENIEEREAAIELREGIEEQELLLECLLLIQQRKQEAADKLQDTISLVSSDIDEVSKQQSILWGKGCSCPELGKDSASGPPSMEFVENEDSSCSGSRKRYRQGLQSHNASEYGGHLHEGQNSEAPAENQGSILSKSSRLMKNFKKLESAYFLTRQRPVKPTGKSLTRQSPVSSDGRGSIVVTERSSVNNLPLNDQFSEARQSGWINSFLEGLCKYLSFSKLKVKADLKQGDLLNTSNLVCSLSFDRDGEFFATAGVNKKIKIFEYGTILNEDRDIHYPVVELVSRSKLSSICWNSYIKSQIASSNFEGVVQVWDVTRSQVFMEMREHERRVWSVDFSLADPTMLASGSDDGSVKLWNINQAILFLHLVDGVSVGTIKTKANVCCVQFPVDSSRYLAFGSADHRIYYYDLRNTKMPLCTMIGHNKTVSYVKFIDSTNLVSASTDNTLKLWDLSMASSRVLDSPLHSFTGHTNVKLLQSNFLNEPRENIEEREAAIELREGIEEQELLLECLLLIQQRKQEAADKLQDTISLVSSDIDEVSKQQSILWGKGCSCPELGKDSASGPPSMEFVENEDSSCSGSRKRYRQGLQSHNASEYGGHLHEGQNSEAPAENQGSILSKSSRLMKNFKKLESAYFLTRQRPVKPTGKSLTRQSPVSSDGRGSIVVTERSSVNNLPLNDQFSEARQSGWINSFLEGLCKYLSFSKLKVKADLKQGDLLNTSNLVCSLSFDRDGEFFATAGVNKKIKIFEYGTILNEDRDIHYPVVELVSRSKLSSICWNSYIKSQIASSNFEGVVQVWDVTRSQVFMEMREHERRVWSVDFSLADPTMLASGSDDGSVKLWNINQAILFLHLVDGVSVGTIKTKANVCCVQFPVDSSRYLAFGSADHRIYYYDLRNTKMPLCTMIGHNKTVSYVKFIDSTNLVSASTDNTLKLWDLSMASSRVLDSPLHSFTGHTNVKLLQSNFLNEPRENIEEREAAIELREGIEEQELLLECLLLIQQRKQEAADKLQDTISLVSSDIDEVSKQQSILWGKGCSCPELGKDSASGPPSMEFVENEDSSCSGSRKRYRQGLQSHNASEYGGHLHEGQNSEAPAENQGSILSKSSRLMKNFKKLESAYFLTRQRPVKPTGKSLTRQSPVSSDGRGSIVVTERSSVNNLPLNDQFSEARQSGWINSFLEGLCKYLSFSKLKVKADLKQGDLLNTSNLVCSLSFDRDGEFFATAGVNKKIKIFEYGTILNEDRDIHYPVVELVSRSKLSSICWNSYIKSQIASSNFEGVVQVWDVTRSQVFMEMREHERRVWSVDFSLADPTMLASGSDDGSVKLWNINQAILFLHLVDGVSVGTIKTKANVCCVQFPVDSSRYLAFGSADHRIYYYDLRNTKMPLCTMIGHNKTVSYVKFIDSTNLVSASTDNTLKLWDLSMASSRVLDSPLHSFTGHTNVKLLQSNFLNEPRENIEEREAAIELREGIEEQELLLECLLLIQQRKQEAADKLQDTISLVSSDIDEVSKQQSILWGKGCSCPELGKDSASGPPSMEFVENEDSSCSGSRKRYRQGLQSHNASEYGGHLHEGQNSEAPAENQGSILSKSSRLMKNFKKLESAYFLTRQRPVKPTGKSLTRQSPVSSDGRGSIVVTERSSVNNLPLNDQFSEARQSGWINSFLEGLCKYLSFSKLKVKADLKQGDLLNTSNLVCSLSFDRDGEFFATAGVNKKIKIFEYGTILNEDRDIHYPVVELVSRSKLSSICWNSYIKSQIASSNFEGVVQVWDVTRSQVFMEMREHERRVWSVDFSLADPTMLASGSDDGSVKLWNINQAILFLHLVDGVSVGTIKTKANVCCVQFPVDSSRYLAFGSADHRIYYYDLRNTKMPLCTMIGHNKTVSYVKFIDSTNLVSASTDNTLKLWDLSMASSRVLDSPLHSFTGHTNVKLLQSNFLNEPRENIEEREAAIELREGIEEQELLLECLLLIQQRKQEAADKLQDTISLVSSDIDEVSKQQSILWGKGCSCPELGKDSASGPPSMEFVENEDSSCSGSRKRYRQGLQSHNASEYGGHLHEGQNSEAPAENQGSILSKSSRLMKNFKKLESAYFLTRQRPVKPTGKSLTRQSPVSSDGRGSIVVTERSSVNNLPLNDQFSEARQSGWINSFLEGLCKYLSFSKLKVKADLKQGDLLNTSNLVCSLSFDRDGEFFATAGVNKKIKIFEYGTILNEDRDIHYPVVELVSRSKLSSICWNSYIKSQIASSNFEGVVQVWDVTRSQVFMEMREHERRVWSVDFSLADPTMLASGSDDGSVKLWNINQAILFLHLVDGVSVGTIKTKANVCCVQFPVDSSRYLAFGSADHRIYYYDLRNTKMPLCTMIGHNKTVSYVKFIDSTNLVSASTDNTLKLWDLSMASSRVLDSPLHSFTGHTNVKLLQSNFLNEPRENIEEREAAIELREGIEEQELLLECLLLIQQRKQEAADKLQDTISLVSSDIDEVSKQQSILWGKGCSCPELGKDSASGPPSMEFVENEDSSCSGSRKRYRQGLQSHNASEYGGHLHEGQNSEAPAENQGSILSKSSRLMKNFKKLESAYFLTRQRPVKPTGKSLTRQSPVSSDGRGSIVVTERSSVNNLPLNDQFSEARQSGWINSFLEGLCKYLSFSKLKVKADLKQGDLLNTSNLVCSLSFDRDGEFFATAGVNKKIKIFEYGTILNEDRDIHYPVVELVSRSKLSSICWNSYIKSQIASSNFEGVVQVWDVTRSQVFMEMREHERRVWSVDFSLADPTMLASGSDDGSVKLWNINQAILFLHLVDGVSVGTIKTKANVCCVQFPVDSSRYLAFGSADHRIYYYDLRNTKMPLCTMIGHNKTVSYVKFIDSTNLVSASTDNTLKLWDLSMASSRVLDSPLHSFTGHTNVKLLQSNFLNEPRENIEEREAAIELREGIEEQELLLECLLLIQQRKQEAADKLQDTISLVSSDIDEVSKQQSILWGKGCSCPELGKDSASGPPSMEFVENEDSSCSGSRKRYRQGLQSHNASEYGGHLHEGQNSEAPAENQGSILSKSSRLMKNFKKLESAYFLTRQRPVKPTGKSLTRQSPVSSDGRGSIVVTERSSVNNLPLNDQFSEARQSGWINSFLEGLCKYLSFSKLKVKADLKQGDLLNTSNLVCSLSFDRDGEFFATAGVNKKIKIFEYGTILNEDRDIHYPVVELVSRSKLSSICWNSYIKSQIASSNFEGVVQVWDVTRSQVFMEMREHERRVWSVDFSLADPTMLASGSDDGSVKLWNINQAILFLHLVDGVSVGTIKTKANVCCVQFPVDSSRYLAFGSADHRIYYYDLRNTKMPLCTMIGHNKTVSYVKFIDSTNLVSASTDNTLKLWDLSMASSRVLDSPLHSFTGHTNVKLLQSNFLNEPRENIEEREAAIELREGIEEQELLLECLLLIQQRKQEAADKLQDTISLVSSDIDEVSKQQSILWGKGCSCPELGKDSASGPPSMEFVENEDSSCSGSRKRYRQGLQSHNASEYGGHLHEGQNSEAPAENQGSILSKSSRLMKNFKKLESAYFLTRQRPVKPTGKSLTRQSPVSSDGRGSIVVTERSSVNNLPLNDQFSEARQSGWINSFLEGLCKYLSFSKLKVKADLKQGDLLNTSNLVCSLSFDRDGEFFATAGVNKKIKIFEYGTILNEDRDIHYPVVELVSRSKLSSICWNSYIKSQIASSNFEGVVQVWDVTRSQVFMEMREHERRVWSVDFSLADPTMLASGSDDGSVKLWNINQAILFLHLVDGVSVGTIKTKANVCCVQFPVDSSRYLAFGSADHRIYYYDLRNTKMPLCTMIGHNKTVSYVKFIDSTNLVSASTDNTLKLWDLSMASSRVLDSPLHSFTGHTNVKLLQSNFLNEPRENIEEREAAIELREGIEEQELLLECLLLIQQRKQEAADKLQDTISLVSSDIDEVSKQQSILWGKGCSCPELGKDSASGPPSMEFVENEDSSCSGSRKRYRQGLQSHNASEYGGHLHEGQNSEAPAENQGSILSKSSRLMKNFKKLESAYFLTRQRPVKPTGKSLTRQSPVSSDGRGSIVVTERSSVNNLPLNDQFSEARQSGWINSFLEGLCKYLSFSKLKVKADLKQGDLLNTSNLVCSLSFDRDGEFFATAGVNKKIKIFEYGTILNEDRDIHYPVVELVSRSKLSSICWNSYIKSQIASSNFEGVVQVWDVTRSQVFMEMREHERRVWSVDFSLADPTMLASGSDDGSVKLWNINQAILFLHLVDGVSVGTIKTKANVCCVQFPVDSSRYLAFGSADHRIYYYDLRNTKMPLCTMIGHNKTVSYVKFIDSTNLVSASTDNTLKLWDLSMASSRVLDSPLHSFTGHTNVKLLQSNFLNEPRENIEEREAAIELREGIEEQELLLECLLLIQQRKQEAADKLQDTISLVSSDIDEVSKQQSILWGKGCSCPELGKDSASGPPSMEFVENEDSSCSGSRKRYRQGLQSHNASEYGGHLHEGQNSEAPAENQGSILSKSSRLMKNFKKLESAYFLTRQRPVKPTGKSLTRQSPVSSDGRGSIVVTERSSVNNLPLNDQFSEARQSGWINSFLEGLCKYLSFSKLKVKADLKQGDLLNTSNLVCSLSFDRDGEFFATAGVNKKIKIFEYGTILNEDRDIHYPVVELVSRSKLSSICWNSYIKSQIASSNFEGVVQVWDVTRSQVFMEMREHERRVWSVDFSLADPTMLASGSDDGSVKLWNINQAILFLHLVDGVSVGTIKTKANVCCVQFPVDSSRYLAFGSADHRIYYYDLRNTKMPLCTMIGHNKTVSYVKFIDSTNLVSASTDNTLKLWDLSMASSRVLDSPLHSFTGHTNVKLLQSNFLNEPRENIEEREAAIELREGIEEQELLLECLLLIQQRKQEAADKLQDTISLVSSDIDEVSKQQSILWGKGCSCPELGKDSASGPPSMEFVENEDSSCSGSRKRYRQGLQSHNASEYGGHLHEGQNSEAPAENQGSILSKSSRLMKNFKKLESAYFLTRQRPVKPTGKSLTRQSPVSSDGRGSIVVTERSSVNNLPLNDQFSEARQSGWINSFLEGLCKYLSFSKLKVKADLKQGDLLNTSNLVCSLSFDRDGEFFATAGVNKKIKIFEYGTILNEDRDIHYPVVELVSRSKLSSICWNSYIKSQIASSNFEGVVQVWDVTRSQVFMEMREHERRVWSVDFSLADPTMLASGSDDGSVKLWNINQAILFLHLVDGVSVGTIKTKANVCCVQFPVDSSRYLAFGSADHRIYYYDLRNTKMPLCTMIGHNKTVSYVKFIDSTNLVSASTDNTLKLWDLSMASSRVLDSPLHSFTGHTNVKLLQSNFLNEPRENIEEREAAIELREGIEEQELLLECLLLIQQRKQEAADKLQDTISLVSSDIDEVSKQQSILWGKGCSCPELGKDSASGPPSMEFVENEDSSCSGSRKRYRQGLQSHNASEYGGHLHEGQNSEAPAENQGSILSKSSRLMKNFKKLESAYFLTRQRPVKPTGKSLTRQSPVSSDGRGSIVVTERSSVNNLPLNDQFSEARQSGWINSFLEGLCKYLSFSKLKVKADLKQGDLLNTSNLVCSLSFDRDGEFFATAGVNKKIKIFEYGTILNEDRDIHYPVVELVSRSKLSSICWNSYIKSQIASSNFEGRSKDTNPLVCFAHSQDNWFFLYSEILHAKGPENLETSTKKSRISNGVSKKEVKTSQTVGVVEEEKNLETRISKGVSSKLIKHEKNKEGRHYRKQTNAMKFQNQDIDLDIPLPQGTELTTILDLKEGEPEDVLYELIHGGRGSEENYLHSPVITPKVGKDSWLNSLQNCTSRSPSILKKLKLERFGGEADDYDSLDS